MTPQTTDDRYVVRLLHRCRIDGIGYRVGCRLSIPVNKLRVAAHLVRTGAARPADERTARDVELFKLLDAAMTR